jgi:hypothetical protein
VGLAVQLMVVVVPVLSIHRQGEQAVLVLLVM